MKKSKEPVVYWEAFDKAFEAEEDFSKTYSGDENYQEDAVLLESPVDLSIPDQEEEEYSEEEMNAFMETISLDSDSNQLSFDEMFPTKKEKTGVLVQLKETKGSHYLVLRNAVVLTPSVCRKITCSYDASKAAGFKEWDKVPNDKKKLVLAILQRHDESKHKFVDNTIMDKSEMSGAWLSPTFF